MTVIKGKLVCGRMTQEVKIHNNFGCVLERKGREQEVRRRDGNPVFGRMTQEVQIHNNFGCALEKKIDKQMHRN